MTEARDLITRVLEPPPAMPGLYLVVGPHEIQNLVLYSLVPFLARGVNVYWIDAGNWFDAYGISVVARAQQIDERTVLSRIQLARPFTAIQMTAMLSKKIPEIPRNCPIILSDPMALFYDHEMPENDVQRIFRDFLDTVRGLTAPILTVAVQREPKPERRSLSKRLLEEVKAVAYISGTTVRQRLGWTEGTITRSRYG